MTFRPALRPGTSVLRRGPRHLQVGTAPGRVIADQPGLHALLHALDGHRDADVLGRLVPELGAGARELLQRLASQGVVVDGGGWDPRHDDEARHLALAGHDPDVLARRRRTTVALHADRGSRALLDVVGGVLGEAGVCTDPDAAADVLVVASVGEPAREVFAEAVRRRIRHLVVRVEADDVHLGPFVHPGRTPCLGCSDHARVEHDPAWAALLPQLGRAGGRNPPGTGAVLRHAAGAAIAASVLAAIDTDTSPHAGAVETWGPSAREPRQRRVTFHHRCACALLPVC